MIQVPLKVKEKPRSNPAGFCLPSYLFKEGESFGEEMEEEECGDMGFDFEEYDDFFENSTSLPMNQHVYRSMAIKGHGMDMGMLGLGSPEGKYTGTKNLKLERDTRFPIRCTFQYYRVTDENHVSEHDIKDIATQVSQATRISLASGSLVASTTDRITEPVLNKFVPTYSSFGKLDERNSLNNLHENATSTWGSQSMVSFM